MIGIFYSSLPNSTKIQDLKGFIYLISAEIIFSAMYTALNIFPKNINIFMMEKDLYSTTVYYFVQIVAKVLHNF